jgi:hypothetical protein
MNHLVPSFFIFSAHKILRQPKSLIIFSLSKIHVTLSGEKMPCFWSVYGTLGLLMGFSREK